MSILFSAVEELTAGPKWRELFVRFWPAYHAWFLRHGPAARPSYALGRRMINVHLPELLPTYDRLVELAGGGDMQARVLALYNPTPYLSGCSQAVWGGKTPFLVRNYDYSPRLWEGTLLLTAWNGRRVLAMSDCLWGVLDGINQDGLTVSLAFGGRRVVGFGFGIPLVLRYILEFCRKTSEATAVLERVPVNMAYNVTVLDRRGDAATVFVAPDRPAVVTSRRVAANHQDIEGWTEFVIGTSSREREALISGVLNDPESDGRALIRRFGRPPVHCRRFRDGWGTLYTSVYRPDLATVELRWPGRRLVRSLQSFREATFELDFDHVPHGEDWGGAWS